jgi:hypothetical protein
MAKIVRSYGEGRNELVQFRVTSAEKQQLADTAGSLGLSLSDYCRARVVGSSDLTVTAAVNNVVSTPSPVLESRVAELESAMKKAMDIINGGEA